MVFLSTEYSRMSMEVFPLKSRTTTLFMLPKSHIGLPSASLSSEAPPLLAPPAEDDLGLAGASLCKLFFCDLGKGARSSGPLSLSSELIGRFSFGIFVSGLLPSSLVEVNQAIKA